LEDYSAGIVFRHEQTLSGPKADRLELWRHTHTHTGQLFMLYSDSQRRVDAILAKAEKSAAPVTEVRDEYGVVHRLWVIAEPERVAAIQEAMADQKLVIADGHHEGILEPTLGITPQAVTSEKNLAYVCDPCEAVDAVDRKAAQVAFLLNACDVEQVMRIVTSGEVMPQKSTDFYPKLLSGIAMYRLDS
jgi:uncharacterized protein (DUF1015 family)